MESIQKKIKIKKIHVINSIKKKNKNLNELKTKKKNILKI